MLRSPLRRVDVGKLDNAGDVRVTERLRDANVADEAERSVRLPFRKRLVP